MNKIDFTECANALRNFFDWAKRMYSCGIDMNDTPVGKIADMLHGAMCDFDSDWSYDSKLGIDWIIEWVCGESNNFTQYRHGIRFEIDSASALYDFLIYMNHRGWED